MTGQWSDLDVAAMRRALDEAKLAGETGEIPVGAAVVAHGGVVLACGNSSLGDHNPTGHAEINALRAAGSALENYRLTEATLYVTLEPCVMCAGAIAQARIKRVVFGAYDPKAGALGSVEDLSDSRALNHRFEINGGLLADESQALLKAFFEQRR